jgi:hypothetical protein
MHAVVMVIAAGILIGLSQINAAAPARSDPARSDYAGQQSRPIKALSEADMAALRNGDGMGFAKAAELNNYPGPSHVLELARELGLSDSQARQVGAIHERMSADARALGPALIEREGALERLFADGTITPESLAAETAAIGDLQARLRRVHLAAHIETRAVLSADQVALYNRLRGYDTPGAAITGQPAGPSHGQPGQAQPAGHSGAHRH